MVILGLDKVDWHFGVSDGHQHPLAHKGVAGPSLRRPGKVNGGADTRALLGHEDRLNTAKRVASHRDSLAVNERQAFQVRQRGELVVQMVGL